MTVNMHQYFYVEYFDDIGDDFQEILALDAEIGGKEEQKASLVDKKEQRALENDINRLKSERKQKEKDLGDTIKNRNRQLTQDTTFSTAFKHDPLETWKKFKEDKIFQTIYGHYQTFDATTIYPGLTIGLGIDHDLALPGVIKAGFSLDTITGLPYIPGSSLKGLFRSAFRFGQGQDDKKAYLLGLIGEVEPAFCNKELSNLEEAIFEHGDVFLGAFPKQPKDENNQGALLGIDYITPHGNANTKNDALKASNTTPNEGNQESGDEKDSDKQAINYDAFKEPNPIPILKVKPEVTFTFAFLLKDGGGLSAEQKCQLFELLLCDLGIGAKTNVGFGQFKNS